MNEDILPLYMFFALFPLLVAGVPIAFALAAVAIVFSYFLWGAGALNILISTTWGTMNNFVIIAVPLFIFMAYILQKTNVVDDLYDAVTGVSIGGLFAGGISAGVLLATLYILYIFIRGLIDPVFAPALASEDRASWGEKLVSVRSVFFPGMLIVLVLGTILLGIASPTEAAAFGAAGAIVIGLINRRLTWEIVYSSCYETLSVTAMVGFMMIGAGAFGSVFSGLGGNAIVADFAMNMPGGANMVFVVAAIFVFILGMFLEPGAVIFLAVPIIAPILSRLGFDPLWIGLAINVILQSAYISPPFGFSLFYLKGCTPSDISIIEIYKSSLPLLTLQAVCLVIIFMFPQIILWLPRYLLGF